MFPDQGSKSSTLFERALKVMPGGNSRHTVCFPPYPPYPFYAASAQGARLTDVGGVLMGAPDFFVLSTANAEADIDHVVEQADEAFKMIGKQAA